MNPDPVIVAKNLGRSFKAGPVLEGVDLAVSPGEVLGLVGPNGGGKSTLLLLMAGLLQPTSGEVRVLGVPAHLLPLQRSGAAGLITAEQGLYPLLSGWENLDFFVGLFGMRRDEVRRRAAPLLDRLGLVAAMDERTGGWSSGMRQKLSLVRALLPEPKVLLLDEPASNLDPVSTDTLHHAVRDVADAGAAVVLCTHDLPAAEAMCDRVALLRRRLVRIERFDGPRGAPSRGLLFDHYRELLQAEAS